MIKSYFDAIAAARTLLKRIPVSTASDASKADYIRRGIRLIKLGKTPATLLAAVNDTTKISTWFARKAAVVHSTRSMVETLLAQQDQLQRGQDREALMDDRGNGWRATVDRLKRAVSLLEAIHGAKPIAESVRTNRKSKRIALKNLPQDWRERIIDRMPSCTEAALVAAVTGCRPSELVTGVQLSIEGGELVALIQGAKTTAKSGQEWRRMYWPVDSDAPLVRRLIGVVERQVSGAKTVKIENGKAFSGTVRAAGFREWPRRAEAITPYCFRHQAAADMKASGNLSSSDISAALGHCSDVTKTAYGHAGMGRKGGVGPSRIIAAKPVIMKKPLTKAPKKLAKRKSRPGPTFASGL